MYYYAVYVLWSYPTKAVFRWRSPFLLLRVTITLLLLLVRLHKLPTSFMIEPFCCCKMHLVIRFTGYIAIMWWLTYRKPKGCWVVSSKSFRWMILKACLNWYRPTWCCYKMCSVFRVISSNHLYFFQFVHLFRYLSISFYLFVCHKYWNKFEAQLRLAVRVILTLYFIIVHWLTSLKLKMQAWNRCWYRGA